MLAFCAIIFTIAAVKESAALPSATPAACSLPTLCCFASSERAALSCPSRPHPAPPGPSQCLVRELHGGSWPRRGAALSGQRAAADSALCLCRECPPAPRLARARRASVFTVLLTCGPARPADPCVAPRCAARCTRPGPSVMFRSYSDGAAGTLGLNPASAQQLSSARGLFLYSRTNL